MDKRDIHQAHDERVHPTAPVSGGDAEGGTDYPADDDGDHRNDYRDAAPVHDAAEDVPAHLIGAEDMVAGAACLPDRRSQPVAKTTPSGVVGSDLVGEYGGDHQDQQEEDHGQRRQPA